MNRKTIIAGIAFLLTAALMAAMFIYRRGSDAQHWFAAIEEARTFGERTNTTYRDGANPESAE